MTGLLWASRSFAEYDLKEADICFLGIPFDSTAFAEGNQRFGPWTLRYSLMNNVNNYVPKLKKGVNKKMCDLGNIDVVPGSFEKTDERVQETIKDIFKENPKVFPVFLGGEHLITLSAVRALKPDLIINFDAHSDMWDDQQGEKFAHSTWSYHAQKELGCKVITLGMRAWDQEHENIFKKLKASTELKGLKGKRIYVTIDIDALDPAYAPDTGFPEPEGLTPTQVFEYIDKIFKHNVIGMDLVEINSSRLNNVTSNLGARIIIRALSHLK